MKTCAVCGPLPDDEWTTTLGGEVVHAVAVQSSPLYAPEEAEPCGPVTETETP